MPPPPPMLFRNAQHKKRRWVLRALRGLLLLLLVVLPWALHLARIPALRLAAANAESEVKRYLFKRFLEPRCSPLDMGSEDDLVPTHSMRFEPCEVPTRGEPRAGAPRVYILEHMAALIEPKDPALPQLCSERDFHRILASNSTGQIVADPADADMFFVPYYAGCLERGVLRREAASGGAGAVQADPSLTPA